jgi:hypothetical protein
LGLLCGALTAVTRKLGERIKPQAENILRVLHQVLTVPH